EGAQREARAERDAERRERTLLDGVGSVPSHDGRLLRRLRQSAKGAALLLLDGVLDRLGDVGRDGARFLSQRGEMTSDGGGAIRVHRLTSWMGDDQRGRLLSSR